MLANRGQSAARTTSPPTEVHMISRTYRRVRCHASSTAVATRAASLKVVFKVPYRVHFGQSLGLVGSCDTLGSWDGQRAVRMTWSQGDVWQAELSLDPGQAPAEIEYKYVVLNGNGYVCQWKPGKNYRIEVAKAAARGGKQLAVSETWDEGLRIVELDGQNWDGTSSSQSVQQAPEPVKAQQPTQQPLQAAPQPAAAAAAASSPQPAATTQAAGRQSPQRPDRQQSAPQSRNMSDDGDGVRQGSMNGSRRHASSGVNAIQIEAQAAMGELQEVLERQLSTLQRLSDPTADDLLMGDRLLAAANLKAVTLNKALRAAQALPTLPRSIRAKSESLSP